MSNVMRFYLHTVSGVVEELTEDAASAFPNYLIEVEPGTKSMEPELFKPGTVDEFRARRNRGSKYVGADEISTLNPDADDEEPDEGAPADEIAPAPEGDQLNTIAARHAAPNLREDA